MDLGHVAVAVTAEREHARARAVAAGDVEGEILHAQDDSRQVDAGLRPQRGEDAVRHQELVGAHPLDSGPVEEDVDVHERRQANR